MMDATERERLRAIRDRYCVPRGCDCIRGCYRFYGRFWAEKAVNCKHPCWSDQKDAKR